MLHCAWLALGCAATSFAQQPSTPNAASAQAVPSLQQTVTVLGAPEPVGLGESARAVSVQDMQTQPLDFQTPEDYLRTDPSVDIQQRGPAGIQSDVSIRGTTFEQTLVLLNGFRINDAETSHFNLDLPVPQAMLGSANVLRGAGSTLYGSDALGGVIDFQTVQPVADTVQLRAGAGSFGENEQTFLGSATGKAFGHEASGILAGERYFSDGFITDRDYRTEDASAGARVHTLIGSSDVLLATSDREFGANQFYGNYESAERTKAWFGSLRQELGANTEAAVAYRRHTDEFILLRYDPSVYENNHIDQSWQAVLRRHDDLGRAGTLYYGLEEDTDSIHSNNLGIHGRNRGAGYADLDLHLHDFATLSIGLREEILSGGQSVFSPSLSGSVRIQQNVKLRASAGSGFRLPTFTDLYYSDPTTIGNASLKPEYGWNFDGGADWFPTPRSLVSATVFYDRQHDTIDYVRANSSDKWMASNLTHVRFAGVETAAQWQLPRGQQVKLGWTLLDGAQNALNGLESEYVANYPVNNASAEWSGNFAHGLQARTRVGVRQRYGSTPYAVWDTYLSRDAGWWRPYLQMTNLSNTGYQEIAMVNMPGRAFVGGVEVLLARKK
jgi:iron complex outermembrane receptor protein